MHPVIRVVFGVPRMLAFAALLACAPALLATRAGAVAPPDSARLLLLRGLIRTSPLVRVTTLRSVRLVREPIVDEGGLGIRTQRRAAIVTVGDVAAVQRIPWAEIERLDGQRSTGIHNAVIGFALGAGLGLAMVAAYGPDISEPGDGVILWLAGASTASGTILGIMTGGLRPKLKTLYP